MVKMQKTEEDGGQSRYGQCGQEQIKGEDDKDEIEEVFPEAWLIFFTNTVAIYKVFPKYN